MSKEGGSRSSEDEDVLVAGFYNPKTREEEVLKRLDDELEVFQKLDFKGDINEQLKKLRNQQFQQGNL